MAVKHVFMIVLLSLVLGSVSACGGASEVTNRELTLSQSAAATIRLVPPNFGVEAVKMRMSAVDDKPFHELAKKGWVSRSQSNVFRVPAGERRITIEFLRCYWRSVWLFVGQECGGTPIAVCTHTLSAVAGHTYVMRAEPYYEQSPLIANAEGAKVEITDETAGKAIGMFVARYVNYPRTYFQGPRRRE